MTSDLQFLRDLFLERSEQIALIWRDEKLRYGQLLKAMDAAKEEMLRFGIYSGKCVVLCGILRNRSILAETGRPGFVLSKI